jgi:hypothetical protein
LKLSKRELIMALALAKGFSGNVTQRNAEAFFKVAPQSARPETGPAANHHGSGRAAECKPRRHSRAA